MAIEWNRVTWYSKLLAFVAFIGVFGLGLYLGAMYDEAKHYSSITEITPDILVASPMSLYRGSAVAASSLSTSSLRLFSWFRPAAKTAKPAAPATSKTNSSSAGASATPSATTTTTLPAQNPNPPILPPAGSVTTTQPPAQPATAPAQTPPSAPAPTPAPTPAPVSAPTPSAGESRFNAYLTGYTYWDNTPPGSSEISNPIIHTLAGGTGTYQDPITLAVGHSISGGRDTLDYPAGTKFYIPNLRRYFIVEDTCGDGSTPQNGPCHTGYQGHPWLDLWIDGGLGTRSGANDCADDITDIHLVIENPASGYAVTSGPVDGTLCSSQFGDTVVQL